MSLELLNSHADTSMRRVKILFIADVFGKPGLDVLARLLPGLIRQYEADLVIANGENGDDGKGLTVELVRTYTELGVNVITGGNHIWDKHPIRKEMRNLPHLLRPLNYPPGAGGQGSGIFTARNGEPVAVISLQGRTYMPPIDCPFRTAERELKRFEGQTRMIVVDMHAEATAEKQALAYFLDGRVSAILGTHTHVQTADERILPDGTGYITDAGMTGPHDSVIGNNIKAAVSRFLLQTPHLLLVAEHNLRLNGVYIEIDAESGRCLQIQRLNLP